MGDLISREIIANKTKHDLYDKTFIFFEQIKDDNIGITYDIGDVERAFKRVANSEIETGRDLFILNELIGLFDYDKASVDKKAHFDLVKNNYKNILKILLRSSYPNLSPVQLYRNGRK